MLTVTLADGPIHGRNFGDGYYRFTAETGYTGIADIGPYLRVTSTPPTSSLQATEQSIQAVDSVGAGAPCLTQF